AAVGRGDVHPLDLPGAGRDLAERAAADRFPGHGRHQEHAAVAGDLRHGERRMDVGGVRIARGQVGVERGDQGLRGRAGERSRGDLDRFRHSTVRYGGIWYGGIWYGGIRHGADATADRRPRSGPAGVRLPVVSVEAKIELHVHLEGSIRPATLLEIARRNDSALPARTEAELGELYEFTDFAHFIRVWRMVTGCLRTADDFRQVVVDYAVEAAGHGAVYLEGIFSPAEPASRGVGWAEIFTGYTEGAQEAYQRCGVTVRLTPDVYRTLDPQSAAEAARWAVRYADRGVVGLGLGGLEAAAPAATYAEAFAIARDGGLALVPHAGEAAGAGS